MEANNPEYFIEGFMIKHFGVYPIGFDKDDLFDEQKIFLIYLMGFVPDFENWSMQMDYKIKKEEIKNIKHVKIEKTDLDVAKLQGKDVKELKKERLKQEKEKLLRELNEKFGIEEEPEDIEIEGLPEIDLEKPLSEKEKLWDMLQGKGLLKKTDK